MPFVSNQEMGGSARPGDGKMNSGRDPVFSLSSGSFVFLNLSFFFVFSNISLFYLYPLALNAMGNGHHVIGVVMGIFSFAAVIFRPLLGKFVSKVGEYRVVAAGMVLCGASSLAYALISQFGPGMLLVRVAHGIGFSAFIAASFSFSAKRVPPAQRGEAFGFIGASIMAAISLAPAFGEILIRELGFLYLYMAAAATAVLAWLTTTLALSRTAPMPITGKGHTPLYREILKRPSFIFLLVSTLVFAHCQATVPNFLALLAQKSGETSGGFFFVSYSSAILVLITLGRLMDKGGRSLFLRLAYPFFALGLFLIPPMLSSAAFVIPALLYGTGMGVLFPVHNAMAAAHGVESQKAMIMSVFTAVYDTGFITGAIISGWISHVVGLETLFFSCGLLSCLGLAVALLPFLGGEGSPSWSHPDSR